MLCAGLAATAESVGLPDVAVSHVSFINHLMTEIGLLHSLRFFAKQTGKRFHQPRSLNERDFPAGVFGRVGG